MPDAEMLRRAAPLFTAAWLLDVLPKALGEMPNVLNGDGEEPVFRQFRYPLAKGVRQTDAAERLVVKDPNAAAYERWDKVGWRHADPPQRLSAGRPLVFQPAARGPRTPSGLDPMRGAVKIPAFGTYSLHPSRLGL